VSKYQDDGHHPVWTRDGAELLFTPGPGTRVSVVGVATRPTFRLVSTEATLPRPFINAGGNEVRLYDMAPDGHIYGFLSSASASAASSDRFRVVLNWVDELKRRVPVN